MSFQFVTATKHGSKARIALMGVSGSGKTFSALSIAAGLNTTGRIGLIDTDRQSARKYADRFSFDWLGMSAYDPDDLTRATIAAAEQGIGILIVDTWSPFWGGQDGMLDKVGKYSSSFEGWRNVRPVERRMMDALLGFPGHVIVNLNVKTEYVVETNDKGRAEPRRIGLKPEQRDGVEKEFDVVLDLDDAGQIARVVKTRCPELAGRTYRHPGADVGEAVQAWLDRDAVGSMLNPHDVRNWAAETVDFVALRERREQLADAGQLEAVVYDRNGSDLVSIDTFMTNRAREIRFQQEEAAKGAAAQQQRADTAAQAR